VDDYESNRDLLSRWLKQEGYSVHAAQDGQTALEQIKREKFDLVLLDIMMPDLDGLELLSLIRRTHPITELPVILVTGLGSSANIVEGLRRGANDYVSSLSITPSCWRASELNSG
jgi:two-component system sensor histidine kinase ChiS